MDSRNIGSAEIAHWQGGGSYVGDIIFRVLWFDRLLGELPGAERDSVGDIGALYQPAALRHRARHHEGSEYAGEHLRLTDGATAAA